MKIQLELEIKPFRVPNNVIPVGKAGKREDGFQEPQSIHISELDSITLEKMCEEFTRGVFEIAKKQRPPQPG